MTVAVVFCEFCTSVMVDHGCAHPSCGVMVCSKPTCRSMRIERPERKVEWRDRRAAA